jgi:hypothetical protein
MAGAERILGVSVRIPLEWRGGREVERRESVQRLYLIANARMRLLGCSSKLFGHGHAIYPGVTTSS